MVVFIERSEFFFNPAFLLCGLISLNPNQFVTSGGNQFRIGCGRTSVFIKEKISDVTKLSVTHARNEGFARSRIRI